MRTTMTTNRALRGYALAVAGSLLCVAVSTAQAADRLDDILSRTSARVADSIERFSETKCTEKVDQQKLSGDGKVERDLNSTYDYLVIFTNAGGELSLDESRQPIGEVKTDKKNTPLLVTNGFATLFLVFHPYYSGSFQFTALEDETVGGQRLKKIGFRYLRGTRSPAALALRGREYPLQLSGIAWIEPDTGVIARIVADIGNTMEDVGLKALRSEVKYAPVSFRELKEAYWFPTNASVEVETPRQHWRNTHVFTDYQRFSVNTEEKVASQ
jgi:hypothetical protein